MTEDGKEFIRLFSLYIIIYSFIRRIRLFSI